MREELNPWIGGTNLGSDRSLSHSTGGREGDLVRDGGRRDAGSEAHCAGPEARGRFTTAVHVQLLQQVVDVILDRGELDAQLNRDFLVRQTTVNQVDDLHLPGGQARGAGPGRLAVSAASGG